MSKTLESLDVCGVYFTALDIKLLLLAKGEVGTHPYERLVATEEEVARAKIRAALAFDRIMHKIAEKHFKEFLPRLKE